MSSNSDVFGSDGSGTEPEVKDVPTAPAGSMFSNNKMRDQAAALRREAAELEISMREEAREKGLPQEVIDKLIPMRSQASKPAAAAQGAAVVAEAPAPVKATVEDVRAKLGYLNTGDAVRFTSELDRLKQRGEFPYAVLEVRSVNY